MHASCVRYWRTADVAERAYPGLHLAAVKYPHSHVCVNEQGMGDFPT